MSICFYKYSEIKRPVLDQSENLLIKCPLKAESCPVADEVHRLHKVCERLQTLTQIDPLTGLYNHGYLLEILEREMERSRRTGVPVSLIMIDLDYFKKINDTYGHEAGNNVLKTISNVIRDTIRRIDIPCRYGGEEFSIILPGTHLLTGVRAADRLRAGMENKMIQIEGEQLRVTASVGVDSYALGDNLSAHEFITRADNFLLEAKEGGRNMVCYDRDRIVQSETEITREEKSLLFAFT